jgi:hypothetical protein
MDDQSARWRRITDKVKLLEEINAYARAKDKPRAASLGLFGGEWQAVSIIRP